MKALFGALLVGTVLLSQPAVAQISRFGPWVEVQGHREQPRRYVPRDQRGERRARPEPDQRRQNRMTDDERRELRRDIDRANRDIYRRKFRR